MSEKISITKDAMKAEAKTRRIRSNYAEAHRKLSHKYGTMEGACIAEQSAEVLSVLRAAGVLAAPESHTTGKWIDIADTVPEEAEAMS